MEIVIFFQLGKNEMLVGFVHDRIPPDGYAPSSFCGQQSALSIELLRLQ